MALAMPMLWYSVHIVVPLPLREPKEVSVTDPPEMQSNPDMVGSVWRISVDDLAICVTT
jgi:hypothetical protein